VVSAAVSQYLDTKWGHLLPNVRAPPSQIVMGGNINPLGIFYINMSVGQPAQSISVAVDTGSFTMLVPGPNCQGCPKEPAKYDATKSTTAKALECADFCPFCNDNDICAWQNTYQTCNLTDTTQPCTVSGLVYKDYFTVGGLTSKQPTRFGVIDKQTKNFQQLYVIDGILGFSLGSTFGQPAQFLQLFQEGQISKRFGMCFDSAGQGGILTLGDADTNLYQGQLQDIKIKTNSDAYVIAMTDVKVGGVSIGLPPSAYRNVPGGGCIVDSGTNILLFPSPVFRALKQSFIRKCSTTSLHGVCDAGSKTLFESQCFTFTQDQLNQFPKLQLNFNNVPMDLPPSNYILPKVGSTKNEYCLGIQNTGNRGLLIIGDTTMESYYTVFDVANNRLQIAPVNKQNCKA